MGFPVGYSELLLPRLLLQVLLLLGHLHRFLLWAFHAVGLGDLIDNPPGLAATEQDLMLQGRGGGMAEGWASSSALQHRRPEFRAIPPMAIEEALPVVRFDELVASAPAVVCGGGDCAVCLSGICGRDEVRRLSNCRHVFHRGCLDRWMAHEQRTCPLCRAPLIPDELLPAASGLPDPSDYDLSYYPSPLPLAPTPTLLRPHELLLNGLGGFQ
uniref:RING-type domain-containing protein n=1 Tax=Oryza glumipatula TaxID=40148 RepID=A0A0D9YWH0_9ORYZ